MGSFRIREKAARDLRRAEEHYYAKQAEIAQRQGKGKYDWLQEVESKNLFFPPLDEDE